MFEKIKYPDGQISAKWVMGDNSHELKMRISSYEDLIFLLSVADIAEYKRLIGIELFVPCMLGQRSDRRFDESQSFDLKVITNIINLCNFQKVSILDPHSDVTMALIKNSYKVSSFVYVQDAVTDIIGRMCKEGLSPSKEDLILVAPDAGAYKKVFDYGKNLNMPVMGAMKHRDSDGKIDLTFTDDVTDRDCLIVDDLCDGGATFLILANKLKLKGARKVYLYVTHGIFSKAFEALMEVIDGVYCTNSHHDIDTIGNWYWNENNWLKQFKVI